MKTSDTRIIDLFCSFAYAVLSTCQDKRKGQQIRAGCLELMKYINAKKVVSVVLEPTTVIHNGDRLMANYGDGYWTHSDSMPEATPSRLIRSDPRCKLTKDQDKGVCVTARTNIAAGDDPIAYASAGTLWRECDIHDERDNDFTVGGKRKRSVVFRPCQDSLCMGAMCEDYRIITRDRAGKIMRVSSGNNRPNVAFRVQIALGPLRTL